MIAIQHYWQLSQVLFSYKQEAEKIRKSGDSGTYSVILRRPKLCGSSLDFEFIRACMKISKIRPKFHFLTKIEIKMTYWLVFLFCFLLSLRLQSHLKAVLSTFKILSCTNSQYNSGDLNVDKTVSKWLQRRRDSKKTKQKLKVSHFYFFFCQKLFVCLLFSRLFSFVDFITMKLKLACLPNPPPPPYFPFLPISYPWGSFNACLCTQADETQPLTYHI